MALLIASFIAGVLTVAAPCILPLLPVIIGGSIIYSHGKKGNFSLKHPLVIVASLTASIIVFTLLLKATTALLGVPSSVWQIIAGVIVILFGINLLFPSLWEKAMLKTSFQSQANRFLGDSQENKGIKKDILLGAALGPVFNSCSPTYALIVAVILPASFAKGFAYLVAYAIGVSATLLLISIFGQTIVQKMRWLSNPESLFKKIIGILFIIVGIAVITGLDKKAQTYVLEQGWYDPIMKVEEAFQ